ncbi:small glutamine-rich tetratricopeptide repeat-containing protein alpha-like [Sarcoptes scabiei]|nr:small glutamine-rich tetratricopeptide repeat-containing protein alpha-like [Sarcoptes scabiei]
MSSSDFALDTFSFASIWIFNFPTPFIVDLIDWFDSEEKKETKLCRSKKKILGLRHNFLRCLIFFFFFFRSDSIDDRNRFSVSNEKQKKIVKHPVEVAPIRKAFTIFNPDGPESQISFTLIACTVFCFNQSLPVIALVFGLISFAKQFDWFAFFCFVHHFFFRQDQRKNFHLSPNDRSVI